jgi:hypothetical protein
MPRPIHLYRELGPIPLSKGLTNCQKMSYINGLPKNVVSMFLKREAAKDTKYAIFV